jgi:hypothetical protein
MKISIFLVIVLFAYGCMTASKQPGSTTPDLAGIERLTMGKSSVSELKSAFGAPDRIVPLSPSEDIWVYLDHEAQDPTIQKATFVVGKEQAVILTATWIPGQSDPMHEQRMALKHFKDSSFSIKSVEQVSHHPISDEMTYDDPQNGVSFRTTPSSQTVSAISFGPKMAQPIAKQH